MHNETFRTLRTYAENTQIAQKFEEISDFEVKIEKKHFGLLIGSSDGFF